MCNVVRYENQLPNGKLAIGWTCTITGLPANPRSGSGFYCDKFCDFWADHKKFHDQRDADQKELKKKGLL